MGFIYGTKSKYSKQSTETLSKNILLRPRSDLHGLESSMPKLPWQMPDGHRQMANLARQAVPNLARQAVANLPLLRGSNSDIYSRG
jgi:hypothetical protein